MRFTFMSRFDLASATTRYQTLESSERSINPDSAHTRHRQGNEDVEVGTTYQKA